MSDPVEELVHRLRRIQAVERAAGVLRWDQETQMPPGGTEARASELSTLSTIEHELWTAPETRRLLEAAAAGAESVDDRAIVREARFQHERRVRVPDELVERLSEVTARAHTAWVEAKRGDDFDRFAPYFAEIVDLRRRYAEAIDPTADPYAVLFTDHEPWLAWSTARETIADLREGLVDLVEQAPEPAGDDPLGGPWPVDRQRGLMREILEGLGFDFRHGRLDESEHPFSTGNPYDARVTTHVHEDDLLNGLTSTIHEFGHALYTQNLPREHLGTPLGQGRDLVVHEANSRLWENHVARSAPFWTWLAPQLADRFPGRKTPAAEAGFAAVNRVRPGPIRVNADELTYHLHIALRVELERDLVHGELSVDQAPAFWDDRMEELIGVRPDNDAEGILQDVHFSHGSIGYFPTYSLGSMLAAQIFEALEEDVGSLDDEIASGRFAPIRRWLREEIHRHGCRYETGELIERATGRELTAEPFLDYARRKFERLWERDR